MEPPPCVQNAMMKQDKKPFTYTPGGINLSEIKSPRMQRRIERNANAEGVVDGSRPLPPPPPNVGPLPPAALAAMRPQPQVQVFPGPPPPPPMQSRTMPPPPPPPMQPLPTQKVTAGGEVLERPDMTKIIPENPMALLRKTSGPAPRPSIADELFSEQHKVPPPPHRNYETQSPNSYQPPVIERPAPPPTPVNIPKPQYQQPQKQFQVPQAEIQYNQPQYQPEVQRSNEAPKVAGYQPPVVERREPVNEPQIKSSSGQVGSLYIPPINQQTQQRIVSPPTPPERQQQQTQSPGTPTLKEAPKPWQIKTQQSQEVPQWARREESNVTDQPKNSPEDQTLQNPNRWPNQVPQSQPAQRWPNQNQPAPQLNQDQWPNQAQQKPKPTWQPNTNQGPQQQQQQPWQPQQRPIEHPQGGGVAPIRIEIRTNMRPTQQEPEDRSPNAVYITQPMVLQHPGPKIPTSNGSPRPQVQPKPVDSQGARIIPIQIEGRSPPSTPGSERSLNRQQSWGSNPQQSNSFKVIQKLTQMHDDETDDDTPVTHHSARYPQNFQQPAEQMRKMNLNDGDRDLLNRFKQVPQQNAVQQSNSRTIPVQIEGNGHNPNYVHPSEQKVPEPKKYTGSSIPSRSFKILQAMTSPDSCANAKNSEEVPNFPPHFSPYSPPSFWPYYASSGQHENSNNEFTYRRKFPVPLWAEHLPTESIELEEPCTCKRKSRSLPRKISNNENYLGYLPYFDPYFYSHYFVYATNRPTYQTFGTEDGYCSMDEMSSFSNRVNKTRNIDLGSKFNVRSKSATPRISITHCEPKDLQVDEKFASLGDTDSDDFEEETSPSFSTEHSPLQFSLQSIKSVPDINVYANYDSSSDEDESSQSNSGSDDVFIAEDESIPHQLSVIFEESERTDSRIARSPSLTSDGTTIADEDMEENKTDYIQVTILKPQEKCETITFSVEKNEVTTFKNDQDPLSNISEDELKKTTQASENIECDKESEKDWWSVLGSNEDTVFKKLKEHEVIVTKTSSDDIEINNIDSSKNIDNSSIYDRMKDNNEILSGRGKIMVMESFVDQLEKIKRNSGLWENINVELPLNENVSQEEANAAEPPSEDLNKNDNEEEDGIDFWSQIKNDSDDDFKPRKSYYERPVSYVEKSDSPSSMVSRSLGMSKESLQEFEQETDIQNLLTSYVSNKIEENWATENHEMLMETTRDLIVSKVETDSINHMKIETVPDIIHSPKITTSLQSDETTESESSSSEVDEKYEIATIDKEETNNESKDESPQPLSIKARIRALQNSVNQKRYKSEEKEDIKISVKNIVSVIETTNVETNPKDVSTKSSVKSFEDYSEEEGDSGVLSDVSRHISDTEEFSELRKLTRYERAATHSRLFKLLQEECDNEDDISEQEINLKEDKFAKLSVRQNSERKLSPSRSQLSLPLNNCEVNLDVVQVNEKLVSELVQSLLMKKKGQIFRNMPKEKLYAAAIKILQEDVSDSDTPSEGFSSLMSPLRSDTQSSTPVQTPQEFYGNCNEYRDYYNSWSDAAVRYEHSDNLPSNAFKILRDHLGANLQSTIVKCPRVIKSVDEDAKPRPPSPYPKKSTIPNEVTNTS